MPENPDHPVHVLRRDDGFGSPGEHEIHGPFGRFNPKDIVHRERRLRRPRYGGHVIRSGNRGKRKLPRYRVTGKFPHVPSAIDLKVGLEFKEALVRQNDCPARNREKRKGLFVRFEVAGKKPEAVRIPLRPACKTKKRGPVKRGFVGHAWAKHWFWDKDWSYGPHA